MTNERAILILTPGRTRFSPAEYETALEMARTALQNEKDRETEDKKHEMVTGQ